MQLTANLAVLATAVAYAAPSVFAYSSAGSNGLEARDYDLDLDAREFEDLDLSTRDLIEEFYQARGYSEFDARDVDMDLEAREFLNFLDARAAPPAATPAAPAPTSTSAAATSPAATSAGAGAAAPSATSTGPHGDGPHHHTRAHMPAVLVHALTDEHHLKLKHYAEVELHIFNLLTDLSDGEPNHHGVKESAEVEKLAKEILTLKKWHHHHGHHGHKHGHHHHEHHHSAHADGAKEGDKPAAHEKHDAAKDATATSTSVSGAPSATGSAHHGHHGHHGHGLHHKIHELKLGSHKGDRYIARAKVHRDRLALISLGPVGDNDEAYESAVKHEKEWLERHQKLDAKHGHHHGHHGHAADPSATGAAATSTSAGAAPSATGADKTPKADKSAEPKTAQGVKRRALRRRFF